MQKRNKISYDTYLQVFDPVRSGEGGSWLKIRSGQEEVLVKVPTSVMYRLYRIGQAYGFRQFRYFESEASIVVGQSELVEFHKHLKEVLRLINDEVLHKYINELIDAIESSPESSTKHIAVSVGNYFP
jgi:hypothetical protein